MSIDPYASCPCGSGKKFKWCCAPYYPEVEKAFELEQRNQHEAALATIRELTRKYADKPPVWGYYAQFLYNSGMASRDEATRHKAVEEAEAALSEALRLNPDFGMAHFLRGQFRENEGELIGALLLYRRAAEGYDPEAHDALANVYIRIYQHETMLNRPVAARAALERVVHYLPADPELRGQFEAEFGEHSPLPGPARKKYTFRPTAKPVAADAATGRFGDARKAFEKLTTLTPDDPAAWFNLGLVLAWTGEQPKAVDALLRSIDLETDDYRAEEAGALVEVLRCGQGMEADADYLSHGFVMPIRDPGAVQTMLQTWSQAGKIRGLRVSPEAGVMMGLIVEELGSILAVGGTTLARVAAKFVIANGVIVLSHPNRESVARVADDLRGTLQLAVEAPQETTRAISLGDVALEALAQPVQTTDLLLAEAKLRDHARDFFENVWIHRPLKSLAGNTPLDAVGSSRLRKRLFGVVKFVEECYKAVLPRKQIGQQLVPIESYSFDALRHKLGLEHVRAEPPRVSVPPEPAAAASPTTAAAPAAGGPPEAPKKRDFSAMNASELAALDVSSLTVGELDQAMRAALKLDARDLAVAFAQAGVLKPFDPATPDRYTLYAAAITGASAAGEFPRAIELAEQGEKYDAEYNGGARSIDYGLKKAQLYVKMKDTERAVGAFEAIIARYPDEGRFYTTAAEEMLRLKNGAKALNFAERGLAKARETGDRDLEGYCQELVAAARKAM
jgi:tetratricopeptide (TPR) repeat protein